jgi:hypothetical protein
LYAECHVFIVMLSEVMLYVAAAIAFQP